jgi:hypothetical protein
VDPVRAIEIDRQGGRIGRLSLLSGGREVSRWLGNTSRTGEHEW